MLKKIAVALSGGLLVLMLSLLAITGAVWQVFGTPDAIKSSVAASGAYDRAVESILQSSEQATTKAQENNIPLDDPQIQQAVQSAFPPTFLQSQSEGVVDGFYGWLSGQTNAPEFTIDIGTAKQNLITALGDYAQNRYESLPVCTPQQAIALVSSDIDAFSVECRIPLVSSDVIRQEVEAELAGNADFLPDTTFTNNDLPTDSAGERIDQSLAIAPKLYQYIKLSPWVITVIILLLVLAIVILSSRKQKGIKTTAGILIGSGLFLLVGTVVTGYIVKNITLAGSGENQALEKSLLDVMISLVNALNNAQRTYYISYITLGALLFLILFLYNKYRSRSMPMADTPKSVDEPAAPTAEEAPSNTTVSQP